MSSNKVIGFLGIDKYEIMLYLAKLLVKLEKTVLLIDVSETSALSYCFSVPADMDSKIEIISHAGLEYTKKLDIEGQRKNYDVILIDYGFSYNYEDLGNHDHVCIVTDKQLHNLNRLLQVKAAQVESFLLLKNMDKDDNINHIRDLFSKNFNIVNVYPFSADNIDQIHTYSLQYGKQLKIKILSFEYKQVMKKFAIELLEITEKEYKIAFKKLKRGA